MKANEEQVQVSAFSESGLLAGEINELKAIISSGLGLDEDLAGFYRFARKDPILRITIKDLYGMRVGRLEDVFGRTVLAILLQMAPLARSEQMMASVLENYGTKIVFDGKKVVLWPSPKRIMEVPELELRNKAKLGYRATRLVRAARFLYEHPISLLGLAKLPEKDQRQRLMEIPGIGKYSAGILLGQTSMPIDAWSVVIMSELILGRTPQDPRREIEGVRKLLEARWGKWGWLAFVYILNDLEHLAKRFHLSRLR